MIKTVIFDIDNTLYCYDTVHPIAFAAVTEYARQQLGIAPEVFAADHKRMNETIHRHMGADCAAMHNRLIRYQNMLEERHLSISHADQMDSLYWNVLMEHMTLSDGADEAMAELKKHGLTIGICTDMTADVQIEKLRRLGILEYVDFMVSSEEMLAEKPQRKLFDRCCEKAQCRAEECVFVGDHLQKDVMGSLAAGMKALWYVPSETAVACPAGADILHSFRHLAACIEELNREETA